MIDGFSRPPDGAAARRRALGPRYRQSPPGGSALDVISAHYDLPVPNCLFCGIVAGQVPATIVVDGKRTVAFRDVNPQAPTHVLVVPRDHYPNVAALAAAGEGRLDELISVAREVAESDGVEATGYRIVFNTGRDAGQSVDHVHAHVLGGRPVAWPPG